MFLRDKALLWNDARTAFLMYSVQGRTWVALGDPVGPRERGGAARESASSSDATTIRACRSSTRPRETWLHDYADFGLTFAKLGEEARVSAADFTLDGGGTARRCA